MAIVWRWTRSMRTSDPLERASRIVCRKLGMPGDEWQTVKGTYMAAELALRISYRDFLREFPMVGRMIQWRA